MKSHNIKNRLEERTIEVSENSWDKLANQLDANDQKKKRARFFPYAACLALLVGLVIFIMAKNSGNSVSKTVVETEAESNHTIPKVELKEVIIPTEIAKETIKNNTIVLQQSTKKEIDHEIVEAKLISNKKSPVTKELPKEIQNAIVVQSKELVPKEIQIVISEKQVVIDSNKELKASIIALSASEKITITDEEIDVLLREAEKSIQHLNVQDTTDITTIVSADDLLDEVEYELDKSFKQKVFELIKSNIQKNRTVIADRN